MNLGGMGPMSLISNGLQFLNPQDVDGNGSKFDEQLGAGGAIAGSLLGTYFGGPAGAMIGETAGKMLGGLLGDMFAS